MCPLWRHTALVREVTQMNVFVWWGPALWHTPFMRRLPLFSSSGSLPHLLRRSMFVDQVWVSVTGWWPISASIFGQNITYWLESWATRRVLLKSTGYPQVLEPREVCRLFLSQYAEVLVGWLWKERRTWTGCVVADLEVAESSISLDSRKLQACKSCAASAPTSMILAEPFLKQWSPHTQKKSL